MRLLRIHGDELSLVESADKDVPQYAILSHTWGPDSDELTFKDLTEGTGQDKAGYRKLVFCAKQAARDGLGFFWVDTCCIDKSSSSEISEAVNSMFQWYRRAVKCYAYLSDVSTTNPSQNDKAIRKSRWFTRGWTLQELIAPKTVEFFSVEGHRLGDKYSLQQTLHEITGIAIDALKGSPLSQFNTDERMSWAERRETKREEDIAYSLLGIFDIHMPLIYGEGRENALKRLRRKIEKATYPRPLSSPTSNVPFRRDPDFVERETILDQVRMKCSVPASCVALVGLGGVGKSQIAIEYSYRVQEESRTTWVFWVHAGTRARLEEGYRQIAETAGINGWDDPKANILRLVRNWLCKKQNGQWIMIIDNADDAGIFSCNEWQKDGVDDLKQLAEPLSDFFPQSPNGSILITSRNRDVAYRLTGSNGSIIEVKSMDEKESLALLEKKLGSEESVNGDKNDAAELLRALDHIPLAIAQAAAYIAQRVPRMTVRRYLEEVCSNDRDRARLLRKDVGDSRRDGRASNSIMATWQISFEYIRKHRPTAARLLSLMSLFDWQGIPESLLHNQYMGVSDEDGNEEADFDDDIHALTSFSLVDMSADGHEFEMHGLVQFSTRKWLELNQELELWYETYLILINDSYPMSGRENWPICRALFPHTQTVVNDQPKNARALEAWISVLFKAAQFAKEMGQYQEAHDMAQKVLKVREATLGLAHNDTLVSVSNLGTILYCQGKFKEAEAMHRRDLKGSEKLFGPEDPDTFLSVNNLALVLEGQGKYQEAEAMHRRTLEISERVLGTEHPDTLISINNLGIVLDSQGKFKEAEAMHRRALEARGRVLGPEHLGTLVSVNNLGIVLDGQGKSEEAEVMHRRALEARERVLGTKHPDTLISVNNLGLVLDSQGKYQEAEAMHRRALEARERVLGTEHPDTLTSACNLAMALQRQGKYKEAEAMCWRDLKGSEKVLGPKHPDTLTSLSNLAFILDCQGKYQEAEDMYRRVLEVRKRALGSEHPGTLNSVSDLGALFKKQGKYKEAETMHQQVIKARGKVLGPEHPDTLISISNLGLVLDCRGKYKEAEAIHQRMLEARRRVLGPEHPDTLTSLSNLALVLGGQGRYQEAEAMHRQALEVRERVLGTEHPDTLTSACNLGITLKGQGKYEEAEAISRRDLKGSEKVLGPEHPDTLTSVSSLALVLECQGKYQEAEAMHQRVLEARGKVLGPEHPSTISSVSDLGIVLDNQGKYEEAETMLRRALKFCGRVLGPEHLRTLSSVNALGALLKNQGKYQEADAMHRRALEARGRVLGPEHPDTLISVSNLALVLDGQGKYQEAEAMHRQALEVRGRVLGSEHPDTLSSMNNLAVTLKLQNDVREAFLLMRTCCEARERVLGSQHPNTKFSLQMLAEWGKGDIDKGLS